MKETSLLGKYVDIIVNFFLKLITYPVWIILAICVMRDLNFHPDFANYWSFTAAIIYYWVEKANIVNRIVNVFKGKRQYVDGKQYNIKQWKIILNNIIPVAAFGIALLLIRIFPKVAFNTNGLTFFAMLLTIMTVNIEHGDLEINAKG